MAMKCPVCGAENPDDKKFCGECGSELQSAGGLNIRYQRRQARQIACVFVLIAVLLIVIGIGIKSQAGEINEYYGFGEVGHVLYNVAWLFALLGVAGSPSLASRISSLCRRLCRRRQKP
jgi:predicted nucleic acid-binding Zn ribbon protein